MEVLHFTGYFLWQGEGNQDWRQAPYHQLNGVKPMFAYLMIWTRLKTDRRAVTALEYGLIAALIAGVIVTAVTLIGTNMTATFTTLAGKV
jgi:pilus assembly protein Flp/PilA